MPCRDYYDDHPGQYFKDVTEPALKKQIAFAESALCAALNALESFAKPGAQGNETSLDLIDYKEAGITKKELVEWRKRHAELDKKHRKEELEAAKKVVEQSSPISSEKRSESNNEGIVFFQMTEFETEFPRLCSVKLPNHRAKHFRTMAHAELVIEVRGNDAEIIKDRNGRMGRKFTISDEDLVMLKLKCVPLG